MSINGLTAFNADLYYNDFNIENSGDKTTSLVNMISQLVDNGVPIDGVGFQMHTMLNSERPGVDRIVSSWQKILDLNADVKIKITELDVRVNNRHDDDPADDVNRCGTGCAK